MTINTKLKLLIAMVCAAIITGIISLFPKRINTAIEVTSSNPQQGATRIPPTTQITLVFNQEVDVSQLQITSSPTENWTAQPGHNEKEVVVSSKEYLNPDTQYSLQFTYKNQAIHDLSFRTVAQQGDPKYMQQVQLETKRDFPLSIEFPYETNLYRASYTAPLTITIRLKTTAISETQAAAQIKSYINNKGGDANAHKYIVISASPAPTPSPTLTIQQEE